MTKKEEKEKHPNWFKEGYEVLYVEEPQKVDNLFKIYKKDKYVARVIYMNDPSGYENHKLVLFTEKNGHFSIVLFRRKFGISITNKMYSREKRLATITYNGKFWITTNIRSKRVTQATIQNIHSAIPFFGVGESIMVKKILDKIQERFTWLRFMREHNILEKVAFNTILSKKIFSLKKALQHEYKVTLPIAKMFKKHENTVYLISSIKHHLKNIDNIESLKEEWLTKSNNLNIFHDSLKLAKTLDKKVNCSWSTRRLKEEHDKWSKQLTDIIFIDANRPMTVHNTFIEFSKFSGYEILDTTKEMAYEGKRQKHCVASYVNKVENGNCGIFRIKDFTLELIWGYSNGDKIIKIGQLRGYSNISAPQSLQDEVLTKVVEFNGQKLGVKLSKEQLLNNTSNIYEPVVRRINEDYDINGELPF